MVVYLLQSLILFLHVSLLFSYNLQSILRSSGHLTSYHRNHESFCHNNLENVPQLSQSPPLKILLLVEPTPFTYVSGYANRFQEMLKFLRIAGDDVRILTPDRHVADAPNDFLGFPITTVRGFEFPFYNILTLSFDLRFETRRLIKEFKPDVIHVSAPSMLLAPAMFWARWYKIPLVMSYHTHAVEYTKNYIRFPGNIAVANQYLRLCHNRADLTLCTSPQLQNDLKSVGIKTEIDVWQKGINTEIFNPKFKNSQMREKLSNGNIDAPLFLYVGRLGKEKKIERLKQVLEAMPGCRLALVGKGPYEQTLRELFKDLPVVFAGEMKGEALSQAFASCDLFLMPSDSETLGFVVLEAMASGVPVVASAAGGLIDIVNHNVTGFLADNNDTMEDFIEHTKRLVNDVNTRRSMQEAGRKWAESLSWEAATSKLRNVQYRKAIENHRAKKESSPKGEESEEFFSTYRPDLAL